MSELDVEQLTSQLSKTTVCHGGVSVVGRTLKLDSEEDCKEIVEEIEKCEDLHFLNLEGNSFSPDACKAIGKALESKPEFKRALWKDMFTGRLKTEIPSALQYLGGGLITAKACLTELDLSDNAFGPIGVEGLASLLKSPVCFQLEELRLNNNGLGISGGTLLAKALLECHAKSSSLGKPLALKVFVAGRNRLENEGAKALAQVFKTLGTLEEVVMPQNGIYYKGITELSNAFMVNTNLQILNLNDNTLTEKGALPLSAALKKLQKLKIINLGDCLLKTKGAILISNSINDNHGLLEELNLSSNEIGIDGGLAVARAMGNKSKLTSLVLDGNQFGNPGREELKKLLEDLNRIDSLGSLSDDESDVDDEEEDEDDEGVSEEEDEEENPPENENELCASPTQAAKVDINQFLEQPSTNNYLGLENGILEKHLNELKKSSKDEYVDNVVSALVKISSLCNSSNESVKSETLRTSFDLYKDVFQWATDNEQTSTVNNALLVYLGLIKSEDKKFKVKWNTDASLSTIQEAIAKGIVPSGTKETIQCFVERKKASTVISNEVETILD